MLFEEPPGGATPEPGPVARTCSNCGAELDPTYRYCIRCGTPYETGQRVCPSCGSQVAAGSRFCTSCGAALDMTSEFAAVAPGSYPVRFDVQYPERLSRLLIFVKWLLAIPQYLIVYALTNVSSVIGFLAFFCILFTKRYPKGLFDLVVGFNRWGANVSTYTGLLRDEYPPFAMDVGRYPLRYEVDYPQTLSRWKIFVKWLAAIPHYLVLLVLGLVGSLLLFISFFAILFTGRYPRGFFNYSVGLQRWNLRVGAFVGLMRDEFPPYSLSADARPGGTTSFVLSALLGLPLIAGIIALIVVAVASVSSNTETVEVSYSRIVAGQETGVVDVEGTAVVLVDAEDPAAGLPDPGERLVSFEFRITNVDSLFTLVGDEAFEMEDTSGDKHDPTDIFYLTPMEDIQLDKGERARVSVIFELGNSVDPASVTYSPGFAAYVPFGEQVRYEFR